jgi:putative transposase
MYHLVWIPKYRRRVLRGKVAVRVRHFLYEACKVNRWWIEEVKVLSDHVHVLIQVQATDTVAEVVQRLKGGTSYLVRKEFPELEEFLWGDSFWADGYFAETVGAQSFSAVKRYIQENADIMPQPKGGPGL